MKFLTFVDVHTNAGVITRLVERASQPDIEFIISNGDLSWFGRGLKETLTRFNRLKKKLYVIPGNHEEKEGMLDQALEGLEHCHNLDRTVLEKEGYVFLGYGGGGFTQEDREFRKKAREWYGRYKDKKVVLLLHGPPFGTNVDTLDKRHVGSHDYRAFIERMKPKLVICGHLHETAGKTDMIGATKIVNPGWEGMVIELK